ncbi:MAG: LacI family DNA-binding transcriptional regulator [Caldilineaceae bacterium]
MAPTIHDIAQKAGVGVGTVSRVLNDSPKVSAATRDLVLRVIAEHGYRPKSAAKILRTSRTNVIGFITDEIATTPYAGNVIRGAQEAARAQGKLLLLVNTGGAAEVLAQAIETLLERQVEGIIYAAMFHQPVTLPANIREVATVLVDCYTAARDLPSVVPDEVTGGYEAVSALIRKGHRRIGFVNAAVDIPASRGRRQGYCQALADHHLPFDPTLVLCQDGEAGAGYDLTLALMAHPDPPTALFYFNDRMAMGGYDALRKLGKRIPDDVGVVSFDNQELIAANLHPPIHHGTSHYAMGQWAIEQLLNATGRTSVAPVQVKLHCPYIERASV